MMHLLVIIHGYPPNYNAGSEVYSQSICNELSKHHQVSVFTREENPYLPCFSIRKEALKKNLTLYITNNAQSKERYRDEKLDQEFAKLISRIQPDIAHVGHLNHLSTGIIDELNKCAIPIIFTLHDFWLMCPRGQFLTRSIGKKQNLQLCSGQEDSKCANQCYQVYFSGNNTTEEEEIANWSIWVKQRMIETKAMISKVDLFIAPSKYLRNRFTSDFNVPKEKIIFLDYGFPTEYLTNTKKKENNTTFTFGYIGTHIPAKGVNQLIQAFCKIEEPATLFIYGRNNGQSTAALRLLAESSKNRIEFKGEYKNENLADLVFSKVDCIVVPSIWAENSPLVIHEAQACEIPVITADYGGMKELVEHKVNGLLFKHRNIDSLREQMEFAINNPGLLSRLGKRGYLRSKNGSVPNIHEHCDKLSKLYSQYTDNSLWRVTIDTNPEDCNLNCIMCEEHSPYSDFIPTLYKQTGTRRRVMKFEHVEEIFLQAKKMGVKEIIPSTMGEPLLYRGVEGIFNLSERYNIKINLTTNGTFPKHSVKQWAKIIIPNTVDVKISWNGATAKTAEGIMTRIDYNRVLKNVQQFITERNKIYSKYGWYCRITFQLTFMQNNMHELASIIELAANLGVDRVKGHHLWAHFKDIETLSMKANRKSILLWNKYVEEAYQAQEKFRRPNGEKVILENITPLSLEETDQVPEEYECPFLGKELWVSATGVISPCCAPADLRKSLGDFGNITNTTLKDVLQSSNYLALTQNYKTKSVCKSCTMRKPV